MQHRWNKKINKIHNLFISEKQQNNKNKTEHFRSKYRKRRTCLVVNVYNPDQSNGIRSCSDEVSSCLFSIFPPTTRAHTHTHSDTERGRRVSERERQRSDWPVAAGQEERAAVLGTEGSRISGSASPGSRIQDSGSSLQLGLRTSTHTFFDLDHICSVRRLNISATRSRSWKSRE